MTIPEGVDPYSPYVPDGMPELKVGMKVRWRISSECDYKCGKCKNDGHFPHQCSQCSNRTQGEITGLHDPCKGRIMECCKGPAESWESHHYFIRVHDLDADLPCEGFWAAAAELIPI